MKNIKLVKLYKPLLLVILSICSNLLCGFLFTFTSDFQRDLLAYSIHSYFEPLKDPGSKYPMLTITPKLCPDPDSDSKAIVFQKILDNFRHDMSVKACRQMIDDQCCIQTHRSQINIALMTQSTFSISSTEARGPDSGYIVDGNQYRAYNKKTDSYLLNRFNTDTFIFISDTLADKLIDIYGFKEQSKSKCYDQLINNEEFAILTIKIDGNVIRASINNILFTNKRDGTRTTELYPYFGIIKYTTKLYKVAPRLKCELDLKSNSYVNKHLFKSIDALGYTTADYNFGVWQFCEDGYVKIQNLSNDYMKVMSSKEKHEWNYILILIFAIIHIIGIGYGYKVWMKTQNERNIFSAVTIFVFVLYGFVAQFIYIYGFWTILPLISAVLILFMSRKPVGSLFATIAQKLQFHALQIPVINNKIKI